MEKSSGHPEKIIIHFGMGPSFQTVWAIFCFHITKNWMKTQFLLRKLVLMMLFRVFSWNSSPIFKKLVLKAMVIMWRHHNINQIIIEIPQIVAPSSVKGIDPLLVIARRSVTPLARCVGLGQSRISGKLCNRTINNTHLLDSAREFHI